MSGWRGAREAVLFTCFVMIIFNSEKSVGGVMVFVPTYCTELKASVLRPRSWKRFCSTLFAETVVSVEKHKYSTDSMFYCLNKNAKNRADFSSYIQSLFIRIMTCLPNSLLTSHHLFPSHSTVPHLNMINSDSAYRFPAFLLKV